uniref:Uncharacterized protein n=1 Tax=viral metagenome TaxID=1070528 RepID=A0A6C0K996_9ZZZZ
MNSAPIDNTLAIKNLFEENKLEDLKAFMNKRKCLNQWNLALVYLFHIVQSAGILTTTIAAGYDLKIIIWVGVGFNILASLINVFEKTNNTISKHLLKDIQAIKDGTFVDEGSIEMPAVKSEGDAGSGDNKQPLLAAAK